MLSPAKLSTYRTDPLLFWQDLSIERADGSVGRLSDGWAPFQERFFQAMAPAMARLCGASVEPTYRWAWCERHRGGSKSSDAIAAALHPFTFSNRPLRMVAVACDQEQAAVLIQLARSLLRCNPLLEGTIDVAKFKLSNGRTGSELAVMSSDTASLYGQLCDVVIADEVSHWPNRQLFDVVLSTVGKRPDAVLLCLMNCGHLGSWAWDMREQVRQTPWVYFDAAMEIGPWISQRQLDAQRRLLPDSTFRRLWQNEWVAATGDALSPADITAAVALDGPTFAPEEGVSFVPAIDLGIKRDASAFVILGADHKRARVKLAWAQAWLPQAGSEVDIAAVRGTILRWRQRLRFRKLLYDPWQSEFLAQTLRVDGLPCEAVPFTGPNLSKMATGVLEAFRGRRIDLYDERQLVSDLRRLSILEKPYGYKLEVARTKEGGHGDLATALAIALPIALQVSECPWSELSFGERIIGTVL